MPQFCNPGDPKGGPWPNGPPKYAPDCMSYFDIVVLTVISFEYNVIYVLDNTVCST